MTFNAEQYWASREVKAWVVNLRAGSPRKLKTDTKYVRAKTKCGAIKTAIANSLLTGQIKGRARLATPNDLGATQTSSN